MSSNPNNPRQAPAAAKRTQQSADIGAAKRQARAKRQAEHEPAKELSPGQIVEITGAAKVDASDAIGTERTDHHGAIGQVEGHYFSPERGVQMTRVRTEDNKIRVLPEDRLTDVTEAVTSEAGTVKAARVGPLDISEDRFNEIFGKRERNPNLKTAEERV